MSILVQKMVQRRKKCRAAETGKGVPMTQHYVVEELAGTEHEAGPRKLHVLEARMGLAQPRLCLGQGRDRMGG